MSRQHPVNIPFLDLKRLNAPYRDSINEALSDVVTSGQYIGGPTLQAFEAELSTYQQGANVVGVSNGLDALRLILQAYIETGRLKPGDEVIVPANTYIASTLAISHAGLTPVPVEPNPATLNIDTNIIARAITPLTRAIMVVHLYGNTCWDDNIVDLAHRHDLIIIEDNAQGIGAHSTTPGLTGHTITGSLGHAAAFSFYPTKNLGALGDAGAVVTCDSEIAHTVRALANYGSDRRYHNIYRGYNCRMDPIQAATLRVKLRYLDRDNNRRRAIAMTYSRLVTNPRVKLTIASPSFTSNYHQLIALCTERDSLRAHLQACGIGTDIHYATPPHKQPCYHSQWPTLSAPVTEQLANTVVSLPIAPYLSDSDIEQIADALNRFEP